MNRFVYITLVTFADGDRTYDYEYLWCESEDLVQAKKEAVEELLERNSKSISLKLVGIVRDNFNLSGRRIMLNFLEDHGMELL